MTVEDITFEAWPKTPRLNRSMIVTEKIDGSNAAIIITEDGRVGAQSRNRLIEPGNDNYGFAKWVHENAGALVDTLGPGRHFGEWWGSSIQRAYGLTKGERRFSLFNTDRWEESADDLASVDGLGVVPVLYRGRFDNAKVDEIVEGLRANGSVAAPGFTRPEGVVVFLPAARQGFKVLCENDELPKGLVA